MRNTASTVRSMSDSLVAQEETLKRIAVCLCQTVPPHQHVPSCCTASMTCRVRSALPKETRT